VGGDGCPDGRSESVQINGCWAWAEKANTNEIIKTKMIFIVIETEWCNLYFRIKANVLLASF
jgi:hypothetical protein